MLIMRNDNLGAVDPFIRIVNVQAYIMGKQQK